ncbi:GNAT family N-acetyltransferase [Bacillus massiliigorillae]|uniref:GNAT family N-acetyltransferase n=1 Tax=Bacillus massiliigorillae TaxID=1243664 RepID=UPI0003A49CBD|nr:N-acetyltransferase [Bacillus massiliigorillae]
MSGLKKSDKCNIRIGKIEDGEEILHIQSTVIAEDEYLITVSEEFNNTLDQQREWIQKLLENEKENLIVAEIDGEVVGWIVFQSKNKKRLSHTGSFGMMISKNFRGLGIGKMLLNELIGWAENNSLIEKISLGVFSTNHSAISLYKSMGFVEEGRKIKEFKMDENEYIDDILMYKLV